MGVRSGAAAGLLEETACTQPLQGQKRGAGDAVEAYVTARGLQPEILVHKWE